jgi:hypothetical protein
MSMRIIWKVLAVSGLLLALTSSSMAAAAPARTTTHDQLGTAGTVASTCSSNPSPGATGTEYWFYGAVGAERPNGVAEAVNRIGVDAFSMEWVSDAYDGAPGWVQTASQHADATGGLSVAPNLGSALLRVDDLPLYVDENGTTVPSGQTVTASVELHATGARQSLTFKTNDRGTWPGATAIGHFEQSRPADATVTINGARVPAIADLTYIGSYLGRLDAWPATSRNGNLNAAFLNASGPGANAVTTSEYAYAEGPFGKLEIDNWTVVGHPELDQTSVFVDDNWVDISGDPNFHLSVLPDLAGAGATVQVPSGDTTATWSVVWSQAGPTAAERSFVRSSSTSDGSRFISQVRSYTQERVQTVSVTIDGVRYSGQGDLVTQQGNIGSHSVASH